MAPPRRATWRSELLLWGAVLLLVAVAAWLMSLDLLLAVALALAASNLVLLHLARRRRHRAERLQEQLVEAHRAVEQAWRRAERASRSKTRFLAHMSHEIRTPLNSIIGFSEVLKNKAGDRVGERYRRFLENIHTSGLHLLALIDVLLDMAKIEAGKVDMELAEVNVAEIAHDVGRILEGLAMSRSIRIEVAAAADPVLALADRAKLKQILYNLLSNAIKFSYAGSAVTVSCRPLSAAASPLAEESVELKVEDRGIGIAREDQARIFADFEQVDPLRAHDAQGTGLGLALTRRLVELHRGRILLDSSPGQGSTFRVLLPVRAPAEATAGEEPT